MTSPQSQLKITTLLWWFCAGMIMWFFGCSFGLIAMYQLRSFLTGVNEVDWITYLRNSRQYDMQDIIAIVLGSIFAGVLISIIGVVLLRRVLSDQRRLWFVLNIVLLPIAVFLHELLFQLPWLRNNPGVTSTIGVMIGGAISGIAPKIVSSRENPFSFSWVIIGSLCWLTLYMLASFFGRIEDVVSIQGG